MMNPDTYAAIADEADRMTVLAESLPDEDLLEAWGRARAVDYFDRTEDDHTALMVLTVVVLARMGA